MYSKSLDPDEIEEVLMDEESDEELEDGDEVVEPCVQSMTSDTASKIIGPGRSSTARHFIQT
jgi:hypothetical protein